MHGAECAPGLDHAAQLFAQPLLSGSFFHLENVKKYKINKLSK
jgi:hypothetical protein